MSRPYSHNTIVSAGKAREVAAACDQYAATALVFLNPLNPHQQHAMPEIFGRGVVTSPGQRTRFTGPVPRPAKASRS
jgi:50S ribosomal subunit-associated GTPase HflX